MLLRADQVNACEPDALSYGGATRKHTAKKNCMTKSAHRANHHADTYGEKRELLIVKLAILSCRDLLMETLHWNGAHTKRCGFRLSIQKCG